MAKQKISINLDYDGEELNINIAFSPELRGENDFKKMDPIKRTLQLLAVDVATATMEALGKNNKKPKSNQK